ncbi:MAG: chemotaxis protein CheW [Gammaproteobacteria bacterium]|nr:chemotaxis protein CheW [Gammaproteobacteria bacterium]
MAATNLVNQNEALLEFLDDLLTEETQDEVQEENQAENVTDEILSEPEIEPECEQLQQAVESGIEEITEPDFIPEIVDASGRQIIVPDWGRQRFQAMVFKVRDLSLAIPLQDLVGVIDWQTAKVEQQAGSMLLLGHAQHADQTVSVVDTARFVFPVSRHAELTDQACQPGFNRIVLIYNGKIGLACEEVYEVSTIDPNNVTWRSPKTRRQWLAGTMLEEMIVLLDVRTMTDILLNELGMLCNE